MSNLVRIACPDVQPVADLRLNALDAGGNVMNESDGKIITLAGPDI